MNWTRNSRLWLKHVVKKVSAFIVPPTCSLRKIMAQCCSQCIVNSYVQARICLQSLNGQRAMPTNNSNIQYSLDSTSRILAHMPACHMCACKLTTSLLSVTHCHLSLDSGGDRDANSAKTVVRSTTNPSVR